MSNDFNNLGVWHVPSVSKEPGIILQRWSVYEVENGDRHFVGWNVKGYEGRASTKIVQWDAATGTGTTKSGRTYRLDGPMGHDPDGHHVWGMFRRVNSINAYTDVSQEYAIGRAPSASEPESRKP